MEMESDVVEWGSSVRDWKSGRQSGKPGKSNGHQLARCPRLPSIANHGQSDGEPATIQPWGRSRTCPALIGCEKNRSCSLLLKRRRSVAGVLRSLLQCRDCIIYYSRQYPIWPIDDICYREIDLYTDKHSLSLDESYRQTCYYIENMADIQLYGNANLLMVEEK
jgi:hypothetical protein